MNTEAVKVKASCCAVPGKFIVSVLTLVLGLLSQQATAATSNLQFEQYIDYICFVYPWVGNPPPDVQAMCALTSTGFAGSGLIASFNLGTANAGSTAASRKKKGVRERLDEQQEKPAQGASADGGGWGFLVTPQYGKSNRPETDLENGYQSDLAGLVVGLDYRFSDGFVLGGAIGYTRDDAAFLNSAGSLNTTNNTLTIYSTWLPADSISIDGYLGYGKIRLDSQRKVVWGTSISGTASGNTAGQQVMGGMSASYNGDIGRVNFSPFISLDSIKTSFDGYNETGTTTLELHFSERSSLSTTGGLGVHLGTSHGFDWGTLLPSARLTAVHEFQNKTRQISNELVITPGLGFLVETDSPDRNYLNLGLGVAAALDGGAQLFLDYEKRTQDRLLSSWAVSLGALVEF